MLPHCGSFGKSINTRRATPSLLYCSSPPVGNPAASPLLTTRRTQLFLMTPPRQGGRGELEALQQAGVDLRKTADKIDVAKPTSSPRSAAIAGETDTNNQRQFVGSINSDLYHHPDCPTSSRILDKNQIWFSDVADAEAAGYKPSKCTIEKLGVGEE